MKNLKICFAIAAVLLTGLSLQAQNITVSGVVKDTDGAPLAGAGVLDKSNPKNGAVADENGKYTITVSPKTILEFSFLSYKTRMESVKGRSEINVVLEQDKVQLETAIAIGYGVSQKSDLTGAVAVVDMEELQDTPVNSVTEALQGRIAGADIVSGTGEPGSGTSIQIRGARSISAGNEPLIVVDGVLDAVSSLDDINPADIVNISVLKDVSSTAIYGSRGANGVILVTTDQKTLKDSKYRITFKSATGISHLADRLDVMDATEYATWQNMVVAARSGNTAKPPFPDPSAMGKGTDWISELSQTGIYDSQYLQINGNSGNTRWYAGAGFNYNRGIVIGQDYKRYSLRSSFDTRLGKAVKVGMRFNLVYFDVNRTGAALTGTSTTAAVYLSPLLDTQSRWNKYSFEDTQGTVFNNPYLLANNITNRADKWNTNIAPWIEIDCMKDLKLKSTFSFTRQDDRTFTYSPSYLPVAFARKQGGTATRSVYEEQKFLSETTLSYSRSFNRTHKLEAMVGFTAGMNIRDNSYVGGNGYVNDDVTFYNMVGTYNNINLNSTSYRKEKTSMSVLGRLNYNYKRRYYLTFTARADGASNFSKFRKWGFFPAAAFRWSLSNEKWFRKTMWLNDLSLRMSAGRSGNDAISSYMSMATITASKGSWLFGDKYLLATMPEHLANSNLTWETTDSYNIGLNFAAFKSRVKLEVDAYWSETSNLLLSVRNSQVTGYNSYFTNMGSTRNLGVELTLNTRNVKLRNFEWNTAITLSHNTQIVTDSGAGDEVVPVFMNPRNSTQYLYGYRKGYPVNALWGYQRAGIWHSQDEVERNKFTHAYVSTIADGSNGSNVGRTRFVDVNGDGLLDQNDVVYLGSADPVVYGGIQNDFTFWGKLSVNLYFAYSVGGKIYNLSELWMGSSALSWNKYRYMLNAWDPVSNPDSDIAVPNWDDTNASDFQVHDASFFRLKTLTVTYKIPISKWSKFFKGFNVGVTGENLFLVKNYNGFDPDVTSASGIRRLDNGSFPRPRTYTFNFQLVF